jgi:hypothetical protein
MVHKLIKPKVTSEPQRPKVAPLKPAEFKPAVRNISALLIGLCGQPKSGKTRSALRLATGLARGGPIAMLDTEGGRGLAYAPPLGKEPAPGKSFAFAHYLFEPPHSPQRFRNAVVAACALRPRVIIVDSVTHEWEGKGGMLHMVDEAGGGFRAWKGPRTDHLEFMNIVTSVPCHFIFCVRLKERHDQVKVQGKWEIVNLGWRTNCDGSVPYDMTVNLSLKRGGIIRDPEKPGIDFENEDIWTIPDFFDGVIQPNKQIDETLGEALADWCAPPKEWAAEEKGVEEEEQTQDLTEQNP